MDQVGFGDFSGDKRSRKKNKSKVLDDKDDDNPIKGLGLGRYRYGIVICKIKENYWQFKPLRTLDSRSYSDVSGVRRNNR